MSNFVTPDVFLTIINHTTFKVIQTADFSCTIVYELYQAVRDYLIKLIKIKNLWPDASNLSISDEIQTDLTPWWSRVRVNRKICFEYDFIIWKIPIINQLWQPLKIDLFIFHDFFNKTNQTLQKNFPNYYFRSLHDEIKKKISRETEKSQISIRTLITKVHGI